jgi:hypothetical protein
MDGRSVTKNFNGVKEPSNKPSQALHGQVGGKIGDNHEACHKGRGQSMMQGVRHGERPFLPATEETCKELIHRVLKKPILNSRFLV